MGDPGGFADPPPRCGSGTITRIRLENFMCHSHLEIELGPYVNFITGQNGSGKSAILTALCIAFGCRAKGTQRASSLKDFIKTGCSYALVEVEVKNEGDDAFERETYGDAIIIERRITDSSSSLVLKDNRGKKVATTRDELRKLVDHFNIDVENPCVVMSQDKSREFLHSGSEKDKFKGTLLQLVKDLLLSIDEQLESANALVDDLESSIKPIEKELCELQEKIKNLELIEDLSQQVQQLKKKLAWAWVYDVDRQLQEQMLKIEKLKDRIPTCQAKIDWESGNVESLRDLFKKKKAQTEEMVQRTQEVRRNQNELQNSVTMATKKKLEIEGKHRFGTSQLRKMVNHAKSLEEQARDIHEQQLRSTQAEESEMEEKLRELQHLVDAATDIHLRLEEEERVLLERQSQEQNEMTKIMNEIEYYRKKEHDLQSSIRDCRSHQTNKEGQRASRYLTCVCSTCYSSYGLSISTSPRQVTAFGGNRVINLLQTIERHHQKFHKPPIGPIGAHVTLANGDTWAPPVENAIGKLLNAFIVTDHSDSMLLRRCAREARYDRLQIIIYDFSRPRLNIPSHLLPRTDHPSTLSVLRSDSDTVLNVLIDVGHAERQILVKDYESGKSVAFDRRVSNVKEVFTLDGYKMFLRGTVETTLPPNKNLRTGRLCASYDGQIADLEQELSRLEKEVEECRKKKRHFEANLQSISSSLRTVKERRINAQRELSHKKRALEDRQKSHASNISAGSSVGEMYQEIESIREEIKEKEIILEAHQKELVEAEARVKDLRESLESLCESAREEINTLEEAEHEIMKIEKALKAAEGQKAHYEGVMNNKVLPDIKAAEAQYQDLEDMRKESYKKASIICPESEIEALGEWDGSTPDKLSALLKRLKDRLQKESQRCSDSIDDLRMLYNKKERKILRKRQAYQNFREKLKACKHALFLRQSKFKRNAALLKRQLTWGFNNLLGKKGISGTIKVDYEKQTLKIEVKMPQDASGSNVRDTKGLSGGERSFSTLCFTLGLHQMIEAPFRAMDEFDVFMDAVSRKISLDTLVDYALQQGSQWIFITPHDISMVKQDPKIKKQQMAAPRS